MVGLKGKVSGTLSRGRVTGFCHFCHAVGRYRVPGDRSLPRQSHPWPAHPNRAAAAGSLLRCASATLNRARCSARQPHARNEAALFFARCITGESPTDELQIDPEWRLISDVCTVCLDSTIPARNFVSVPDPTLTFPHFGPPVTSSLRPFNLSYIDQSFHHTPRRKTLPPAKMDGKRHPSSFQQLEKLGEGTYATVRTPHRPPMPPLWSFPAL